MKSIISFCTVFVLASHLSHGGSATWKSSPGDGNWRDPTNWRQVTVPDGPDDIATFDRSFITDVFVVGPIEVNSIVFDAAAKPYTVSISYGGLVISGDGVTNNSTVTQHFLAGVASFSSKSGDIYFTNAAAAGDATYTIEGSQNAQVAAALGFRDSSSAGNASFVIQATTENDTAGIGGFVGFSGNSTASNASFTVEGDSVVSYLPSEVSFSDSATVSNATFTINGGNSTGGHGATVYAGSATAEQGNATITINGGTASGANGGYMKFNPAVASAGAWNVTVNGGAVDGALGGKFECDSFDTGDSTYTANGGSGSGATGGLLFFSGIAGVEGSLVANGGQNGGGGGTIQIVSSLSGASPTVSVFGNGTFDISGWTSGADTISSLGGDGLVFLGANSLTVDKDSGTPFAGIIADGGASGGTGGSLVKEGSAILTLSGANTYTGGTVVNSGALMVVNTSGTGTGTGPVQVNAGILGGPGGTIAGAVTVGTVNGLPAALEPSWGQFAPATFTIGGPVTFEATSEFAYSVRSKIGKADLLIANGVTINSGAIFQVLTQPQKRLPIGLVITVINNTSATAISGTFSNASDGSIVNIGRNRCQISYEGGDGNDLTLTVVP